MKISEKQLLELVQTLGDTLIFYEREIGDPFYLSHADRSELLNEIFTQQSEELKDIKDE